MSAPRGAGAAPAPAAATCSAPGSPCAPPGAAAAVPAPRRWRLRDAAGSLASLVSLYGAEGVGLLVPNLGGAVDLVVVRQPDGSLKSSPFYGARAHAPCALAQRGAEQGSDCVLRVCTAAVRFGKYQGVIRSRLKRVEICVNGNKARAAPRPWRALMRPPRVPPRLGRGAASRSARTWPHLRAHPVHACARRSALGARQFIYHARAAAAAGTR